MIASNSVVTVKAEQQIGKVLDEQRDLYVAKSGHEKKLLSCIKKLAARVAAGRNVSFDDAWWLGFREFARANQEEVSACASAVVADYLVANGNNKSAGHVIRSHYLNAFESWGIFVSEGTKQKISEFRKLVWNPAKATRDGETKREKAEQYEKTMPLWWDIVAYLRSVTVGEFRAQLCDIVYHQARHNQIASHSFVEMKIMSNKTDGELSTILRAAVAYSSLLFYTGMRSITGVEVALDDFATQQDNSVLLTRTEHKCGSMRNVSKQVYVRLAHGKDPTRCTLVHLAEFLGAPQANGKPLPERPFTLGFSVKKEGSERTNSCKLPQNRATAVLHAAAIACGLVDGLSGKKKLHLLRLCTENQLLTKGASPRDREQFIGWDNSVQSKNYTISKQRALESNAPYLMAGRDNAADAAHPLWDLMGEVPLGETLTYWEKVLYLVNAAGVPTRSEMNVDPAFKARMEDHIKEVNKARAQSDNPVVLRKRVRELEQELQVERTKRAKLELELQQSATRSPGSSGSGDTALSKDTVNDDGEAAAPLNAEQTLQQLVADLGSKRKDAGFPSLCNDRYPELARLIDACTTKERSYGVALASATGKNLIRILWVVALYQRKALTSVSCQNWFTFVDKEKRSAVHNMQTKSWADFRKSLCATA